MLRVVRTNLGHLFSVCLGVKRSFCKEDWVFFWGNTELVVEGVMPDLFHVIPVSDDAVLDGVFQGKDTSLALGLIADVAVLLTHAHHHTLMPWATDDGREDGPGGVVSGETGLAHAGAIINNKSGYVLVAHDFFLDLKLNLNKTHSIIIINALSECLG